MFNLIKENEYYKMFMNGEWVEAKDFIEIKSPVDEKILGYLPAMSKKQVTQAIQGCSIAQKAWEKMSVYQRSEIILKGADNLYKEREMIANLMANEISKEYKSCLSEVVRSVDLIRASVEAMKTLNGEVVSGEMLQDDTKGKTAIVKRVPLGVILAISPFNYPVNLAVSKIIPALLMGNTVVFKPATQGALSALHMVRTLEAGGLMKGVLNVVSGNGQVVGPHLMQQKEIAMINFTGSTAVGRLITEEARLIPLVMELGGKDAAIVLDTVDINKTVDHIVKGAFSYSGQRCTAIKRVIVLDKIADELVKAIKEATSKVSVGLPFDGATVTPLINMKAANNVLEMIDEARKLGADIYETGTHKKNLIYPTLLDHVTSSMRVYSEEPFGPILPIIRVADMDEAIKVANESEYGLQSSVFGKNIDDLFTVANALEVGSVNLNGKSERGPDNFPFLGRKNSGIGVQGIKYTLLASSTLKSIVINL